MNSMEGACACCGEPVQYTGVLPILCVTCREARKHIAETGSAQLLAFNDINTRLFLPESELMPKPVSSGLMPKPA